MTVWAYLRVSTDEQDVNSQKLGVLKKAEELNLKIDKWAKDEGVSGVTPTSKRALGKILRALKKNDVLIVSELSRLARDLFLLMDILKVCRDKEIKVFTVKENFEIKDDVQSKTLVFSYGLAAEIERTMMIKRTIEGIERARKEGKKIGRPLGFSFSKLNEDEVRAYIDGGMTKAETARQLGCTWSTLHRFMRINKIEKPKENV